MTLIICEKDNAAKRIANILSGAKDKKEVQNKVSVYRFNKGKEEFAVIGLRGHILNLDYPGKYNQWGEVDPRELISVPPIKDITASGIVTVLRKLAKEHDDVIIATDFDREGELIGVEGLHIVEEKNDKAQASRARFSALTKTEVTEAFDNPSEIDYNLSDSAETRQIIDLAWGASLTRFISINADQIGKDFLSVGRVQSPTLAIVVDREKEIKAFIPKPYWEIIAQLGTNGAEFQAKHKEDRFWKKDQATSTYDKVKGESNTKVVKRNTKKKKEQPPAPFDTTAFLRAVNTLGVSAPRAMSIAEDLYTNGYISYPRTDNTVYPASLELRDILEELEKGDFSDLVKKIQKKKELKPTRGKKSSTDHPPIHPVGSVDKGAISKDHWKVYELIVRRFLATLADPSESEVVTAEFDINGEIFSSSGTTLIVPGWREFYHYFQQKESTLPPFEEGDTLDINTLDLLDKETKPPNRHTQGSLIQEMDKLGLGTKSTRHEIIQKLYERGYIENSPPQPTLTGFAVVEALENYANVITKPDMTSTLENDMDEIAQGNKDKDSVVNESRDMLEKIFDALEKNREKIGEDIKKALYAQNIVGACPRCGHEMYATKSRWGKRYVRCSYSPQCQNTYPLPQRGKLVYTDKVCETCRSPLVRLIRRGKRPWEFCVNMHCPTKNEEGASDG